MTAQTTTAARMCESCGERFERRKFASGRLEDAGKFAKRRFCSRACYRKASADGFRLRPPGAWFIEPHQLKSAEGGFAEADPPSAVSGRYPWDRQRASSPPAFPGHFSAERQTNFPNPRQESP